MKSRCYWNMSDMKEEKLKCNIKEKIRKTSQTMQLNKQNENYTKRREIKNNQIK